MAALNRYMEKARPLVTPLMAKTLHPSFINFSPYPNFSNSSDIFVSYALMRDKVNTGSLSSKNQFVVKLSYHPIELSTPMVNQHACPPQPISRPLFYPFVSIVPHPKTKNALSNLQPSRKPLLTKVQLGSLETSSTEYVEEFFSLNG